MADAKLTALTETSVPALDDPIYTVDVSDTTDDAAGSSRKLSLQRVGGLLSAFPCQGRLTTESGVPVSIGDRTSQGTIYFTPFKGNSIALYDGTRWNLHTFSEISLALSSLTSGANYDVFAYDNAGTLTLELSAAWTNDSTRADAINTQDGVQVKNGAATRRHIGTIRTTGTATTEDSQTKRFVWNRYNQQHRHLFAEYETSHTYNSTTWRGINAQDVRIEWVQGDTEAIAFSVLADITGTNSYPAVGAGLDWTSGSPGWSRLCTINGQNPVIGMPCEPATLAAGYHYIRIIEGLLTGSISSTIGRGGVTAEVLL